MKKGMLLLLSLLFIFTGCTLQEEKAEKAPETPSILGEVVIDGETYEMEAGGFFWENKTTSIQTDAAHPRQIAERYAPIKVDPNEEIQFKIADEPELEVLLWEDDRSDQIEVKEEGIIALEEGKQIYEVVARWEKGKVDNWDYGEVSYTFVVEVEE